MTPESLMQMLRALLTPQAFDEMVASLGTMSNKTRIDPMGGQTTVDALPAGAFDEATFIRQPSQSSPFTPPNALRMGGSAGNGLPGTRELPPGPLNIPGPRPLGSPPPIPAPGPPIPGRKPLPRGGPQPIPPPAQPADDFIARLRGNLPRLPGESTNIMAAPAMRERILAGDLGAPPAGAQPTSAITLRPSPTSDLFLGSSPSSPLNAGRAQSIAQTQLPMTAPGATMFPNNVSPTARTQLPMTVPGVTMAPGSASAAANTILDQTIVPGGVGGGGSAPSPFEVNVYGPNLGRRLLSAAGQMAGTAGVGFGALDTASKASQGLVPETIASGLGTLGGLSARFPQLLPGILGSVGRVVAGNPIVGSALMLVSGNNAGEDRPISAEERARMAQRDQQLPLEQAAKSYGVYDIDRLADMAVPFDPSRFQGPGGMLSRTAFAPAKRKGPPGNAGRRKAAGTYTGDVIEPMNLAPPGMKLEPRGPMSLGNFQLQPGLTPNRKPILPTPGQSETGGAADVEDTFDNLELLQLLRQQMGTGEVGARFDAPRRPMGDFSGDASSAAMMRDREALRRRTGGIRPSPSGAAYMDAPGDLDPLGRRPRSFF